MANYDTPPSSPTLTPTRRRMRPCARRCESLCCTLATYFPLTFVYGITTWAVWVDGSIGFKGTKTTPDISWLRRGGSILGITLYVLLNSCYTVAVFTDPGSPTKRKSTERGQGKYSVLPTSEPVHDLQDVQTITVSSSGTARYCKKCHVSKPDRAHHCSTCKRCVLKMDHHCPWLATCLGLHNYKAFLLFLIYVSLFCWVCFLNTAHWVWIEIFASNQYLDQFAPVNVILLAVLSGIIGLVITGFTAWHIYLVLRGQTTIECLEKTRYLSGVRQRVEQNRQEQREQHHKRGGSEGGIAETLHRAGGQILEFHANAVPGASRFEEGEERGSPTPSPGHTDSAVGYRPTSANTNSETSIYNDFPVSESDSPAQQALRRTYSQYETDRDRDRYEDYLSDKETEKMPNAFDLGWRRNLTHLLGPNVWLWWLPICNTTGDGWRWEVSEKWIHAQREASRRKDERQSAAQRRTAENNNYSLQLRGGAGRHNHGDHGYSEETHDGDVYGQSAMSMHTLHRSGSRRQRRDFDNAGEDGEVASFEVSDSDSQQDSSENDSDSDVESVEQHWRSNGR